MTETINEIAPAIPTKGIAEWAAFKHFERMEQILTRLTRLSWSIRPDSQNPGTYYIAGPPETEVVAEGLTIENAQALVDLVNDLPEALEYFKSLAKLWDVLSDGDLDDYSELDNYLKVIQDYQLKIAQLEGNPAPIPAAATAADLSFMHVGRFVTTIVNPENSQPIRWVKQQDGITVLGVGTEHTYAVPSDSAVTVVVDIESPVAG